MKHFILVLMLTGCTFAALNPLIWSNSGGNDFNTCSNWTGTCISGTHPTAGDSCVFNVGTKNCSFSADDTVGAIYSDTNVSIFIQLTTHTLTVMHNAIFKSPTLDPIGTIIMAGPNSIFYIGPQLSALWHPTLTLVMNTSVLGTINFDLPNAHITSIVIGPNDICQYSGATLTGLDGYTGAELRLKNGATFTNNSIYPMRFFAVQNFTPFAFEGTYTLNGTGDYLFDNTSYGSSVTMTFPDITYIGTGKWEGFSNNLSYSFSNLTLPNCPAFILNLEYNNDTTTFSGNVSIPNGAIAFGAQFAGAYNRLINCGPGTFTCVSFSDNNSGIGGDGNIYINFQSSKWLCSGNWTFNATDTIFPGTSSVTINPTVSSTITSAGKPFYNLKINGSTGILTQQADSTNVLDTFKLTTGRWQNNYRVRCQHLVIATTDSIFINDTVYCHDSTGVGAAKIKYGPLGIVIAPLIITYDTVFTKATNGSVSPALHGDSSNNINHHLSFTATVNAHYKFTNWTDISNKLTFLNSSNLTPVCSLTTTANDTVQANFHSIGLTLTVSQVGSGTTTPTTGAQDSGVTTAISATPASGWMFTNWTTTGGATLTGPTTSASNGVTLTSAGTVTAVYANKNKSTSITKHILYKTY